MIVFAIFSVFLMISTVSAVPKINSDPLMDKIKEIEEYKKTIDEKVSDLTLNVESGGIIDIIRQIIQWLIDFVRELIVLVLQAFKLVELIKYLIGLLVALYELIMVVVNYILDLFSPSFRLN